MDCISVIGGRPLEGEVQVHGAKNAILPIMAAAILCPGEVILEDCPRLADVSNMAAILRHLGCEVQEEQERVLRICCRQEGQWSLPEGLSKELRSSIFLLGPLLGRFGRAKVTFPGGCEIGNRPIDLHLKGLRALGAQIEETGGYIYCDGSRMHGAEIHLDYPSVGATENLMMAAVCIAGQSVLHNVAREPEIQDLQRFLQAMGAKIEGAGSSTIRIQGGTSLHSARHRLLGDRIVAGTYMVAAAITGGNVNIKGINPLLVHSAAAKLQECGCSITAGRQSLRVQGPPRPREISLIETLPYPGFPTDMQAQFFALCSAAQGTSVIVENVFESRFKHAAELSRMGGESIIRDRMAIIRGTEHLKGARVQARDLRGGAALVLAGLRAEGETIVETAHLIDRGYEELEKNLAALGADIRRIRE